VCAAQVDWSVMVAQTSGAAHTPEGHVAPAGQATPSTIQLHPFGSAPQSAGVVCAEQLVTSVAGICWVGGACVKDDSHPSSPIAAAESAALNKTM
jgi:hypothetical protein